MVAEYDFWIRDPRTLEFVGELRPQDIIQAEWVRKDVSGGSFSLIVPRERVSLDLLDAHNLVEIRRNGEQEFIGVLESREIDPLGKRWTLAGPDLLGFWLPQRLVGAVTADNRSGVAEDILVAYIEANLGSIADPARKLESAVSVSFSVDASSMRGLNVNVAARRRYLDQIVMEICRDGDILPELTLNPSYTGYQFKVKDPFNATQGSGGVPFAVAWENVEELVFREDYREYKNHGWIFGEGSGDTRPYTEVEEPGSVTADFRREFAVDARYASDSSQRTQVGDLELYNRNRKITTVRAKPFRASANAEYRTDWDVGWDITFSEPALRSEPIDIRVVAATVRLDQTGGESFTFDLGEYRMGSTVRRIVDALAKLQAASLE